MRAVTFATCILATCLAAIMLASGEPSSTGSSASWNGKAAAAYLDGRMTYWMGWDVAARDHGTFCVCCNTVASYVMARPLEAANKHVDIYLGGDTNYITCAGKTFSSNLNHAVVDECQGKNNHLEKYQTLEYPLARIEI